MCFSAKSPGANGLILYSKSHWTGFCYEYTAQHFCDKRQQVNILHVAIHITGGVSIWFLSLFLGIPCHCRSLVRSDNTAYVDLFTILLFLIFYGRLYINVS